MSAELEVILQALNQTPVEEQAAELVERKGLGHPDSICDAVMEDVSVALCREYRAAFGRILHFNVDKCLLVAGRTEPTFGGGHVIEPMRLIFGDRASMECDGKRIDVGAIAAESAKDWLRRNLRFVDPEKHVVFQNELKQGSPELSDIFKRRRIGANDTSVAVGCAPLSETEHLVLACEHYLNSTACKERFPEAGEDVKVMAYRSGRTLNLTVALAFVDRFVPNANAYFARKQEIISALEEHLRPRLQKMDCLTITLNALDDPARGKDGVYLTVLGTSAEGADCGQVGRGNKINGLISMNRPLGSEAIAGKNPISHVGKIYTFLAQQVANRIHASVPGVREVYIWLGSQIGQPIGQPAITVSNLILAPGCALADVEPTVKSVIHEELAAIDDFTAGLARGGHPVC